jgi:hypothetical protein
MTQNNRLERSIIKITCDVIYEESFSINRALMKRCQIVHNFVDAIDGGIRRKVVVVERLVGIAFGITKKFRTSEELNVSTTPRSGLIDLIMSRIKNNEELTNK